MKTVAVLGAGVAGLTAAHEFANLGYNVLVYETNPNAGGFFRSARTPVNNIPSEYSWHGMGPWYHNVFDIMKQIPFDDTCSLYDRGLSRPLRFGIAPDNISLYFDSSFIYGNKSYRMSFLDGVIIGWSLLKTWASHRRSLEYYSRLNAAEVWEPLLSKNGLNTWKATFGPWIGSDWPNVSLHHVGQFFRKNMLSGPVHHHPADEQGPAWKHHSRQGWLLLRGPSNECWFDRWVRYLKTKQVAFFFEESLSQLNFDGKCITGAQLASGVEIKADYYVLAINPFAVADILKKTPALVNDSQLKLFDPLTNDGPHTQVSFRVAFSKPIKWPEKRTALVIADSAFNLTIFSQEQVWLDDVNLGENVKSLWTGTACVANAPGKVYGLPLFKCTKEQFIEEIKAQLFHCEGLNFLIKEANNGNGLDNFPILNIEAWHEWIFSQEGIKPKQPKWVNNTNNQSYLPSQVTSIPNLVLAGAHTKTTADLWSIEAAVESGRLAAKILEPNVKVIAQYKPLWLRIISAIDNWCYAIRAPHILDLTLIILLFISVIIVFKRIF